MFCETSVAIARIVSDWLPPSALPNNNDEAAVANPSKSKIKAVARISSLVRTDIRARIAVMSGISAVSDACFSPPQEKRGAAPGIIDLGWESIQL